jgi:hypothetical protein
MTSVEATAQSSFVETTRANSSAINAMETKISVDHELLRNLLVGAYAAYDQYDYEGEDITDDYYSLGPTLTYLWNRNLSAKAEYSYRTVESNLSDREFEENRFLLSITGGF